MHSVSYNESTQSIQSDSLYFIQSGRDGPIKIGRSRNIDRRMIALQVGNPEQLRLLHCSPNAGWQEAFWHTAFLPDAIGGEWFKRKRLAHALRLFMRGQSWFGSTPMPVGETYAPDEWAIHLEDAFEGYEEEVVFIGREPKASAVATIYDPDFDGQSINTRFLACFDNLQEATSHV